METYDTIKKVTIKTIDGFIEINESQYKKFKTIKNLIEYNQSDIHYEIDLCVLNDSNSKIPTIKSIKTLINFIENNKIDKKLNTDEYERIHLYLIF